MVVQTPLLVPLNLGHDTVNAATETVFQVQLLRVLIRLQSSWRPKLARVGSTAGSVRFVKATRMVTLVDALEGVKRRDRQGMLRLGGCWMRRPGEFGKGFAGTSCRMTMI
jgi:hypothetical protein